MKKIVICEGKFDNIFLNTILKELDILEDEVKVFNIEKVPKEKRRIIETAEIGSFIDKNNSKKIFIKIENGKDYALKIYSHIMPHCAREINHCCLILDLDTENVESKLKKIQEKLKYLRRANPIEMTIEEKGKHEHLHHFHGIIKTKKSKRDIGNFKIIFFKKSLEISCNINKQEDGEEDKIRKIEEFVIREEISKFFKDII